jgi:hypothetical protein
MRTVVSAILVASCVAVGAAAQQPATPADRPAAQQPPAPQGEQPTTRAPQPSATQESKVTISGCIQNAPAAPGGAAASTPAAKFELANAKMSSTGAVGTSGAAATSTRYRLEGDEKTISPHVNHQVEITGVAMAASGANPASLKVESVKMVAAKCP